MSHMKVYRVVCSIYENGKVVDFLDTVDLTELERTVIIEALDQAERSKNKLIQYKENPIELIADFNDISYQYVKIKGAYLSIRYIVETHWNEYTEIERQTFLAFDELAFLLDNQFSDLNSAIAVNEAIKTALSLVSLSLKVAALI